MKKNGIRGLLKTLFCVHKNKARVLESAKLATQIPDEGNSSSEKKQIKIHNVLVYAIERENLIPPKDGIRRRNFHMSFEPFRTKRRFNEFDGVFLFQGCFEEIEHIRGNYWGSSYHNCEYEKDELDKRLNEVKLLLRQGGFICFLLCRPFIDSDGSNSYKHTDLAKMCLNIESFYRNNLRVRTTGVKCKRSEFARFLEIYGAAHTTFEDLNHNLDLKTIATVTSQIAGMIIWNKLFFLPVMIPDNTQERVTEFFTLLADAVISTRNKLVFEIPEWVNKFVFDQEVALSKEKSKLVESIQEINVNLERYREFKGILIEGDEQLVRTVSTVLSEGFEIPVNSFDEYKEDIKILNEKEEPIVFCEVKGVNRGVKREHVNQADSHRERAGLPSSFPAILVMNTHIKNTRSIDEKDKNVHKEQIIHARKNNVLILRTLDLLRLLKLKMEGEIDKNKVLDVLCSGGGWLKVSDDNWERVTGEE